jgi:hypothetical protein
MPLALAVVGTVAGGVIAAKGASKAAKAQQQAATDANAVQERIANADREQQQRQYQQTRTDFAPYRGIGYGAINNLARISGIATPGYQGEFNANRYAMQNPDLAAIYGNDEAGLREHWDRYGQFEGSRQNPFDGAVAGTPGGAPDMSGFFTDPSYQWNRDEQERGLENTLSARGGAFSGNALRALSELQSNLASREFGNYWNRQAGLADLGQGGTAQTANAGANAANQTTGINQNLAAGQSRNILAAGDARASGIQGQYNAWGDAVGTLAGIGASRMANRNPLFQGVRRNGSFNPIRWRGPRY